MSSRNLHRKRKKYMNKRYGDSLVRSGSGVWLSAERFWVQTLKFTVYHSVVILEEDAQPLPAYQWHWWHLKTHWDTSVCWTMAGDKQQVRQPSSSKFTHNYRYKTKKLYPKRLNKYNTMRAYILQTYTGTAPGTGIRIPAVAMRTHRSAPYSQDTLKVSNTTTMMRGSVAV